MARHRNIDFGMDEVLQVSQSSSQTSVVDEEEMVKMEQEATPESTARATNITSPVCLQHRKKNVP